MGTQNQMEPIDDEQAIMDAANDAGAEEGNNEAEGDADEELEKLKKKWQEMEEEAEISRRLLMQMPRKGMRMPSELRWTVDHYMLVKSITTRLRRSSRRTSSHVGPSIASPSFATSGLAPRRGTLT